ncbi:restriction endonuclease subunit S [Acinetobacter sichuanensis]|uniref:Restriction endonuclease subunit S n=1 Tax=Acinetobacter sichuanensis TaxID=2136183 RepID=A0A371YNC2_9GAMM|nr:restriction endonuclease subunit S [Acinetobacter sichuanensis]RFC82834.1 restriction endonuclease subunit S [Acinetobacter sichuanensis]
MNKYSFEDIVIPQQGFLRGPFGGDLKKEIFVEKSSDTYKVYEQGVVLNKNSELGRYYISNEYFNKKMKRFEVKPGDFLVSCSGVNYGAIYQLGDDIEKGIINQALLRIRLNSQLVDDSYFIYLFKSYIVNMIVGRKGDSTIPNFPPLSFIKKLEFPLPDLKTQKKIGHFLKLIDSKIECNNTINLTLEKMAKKLYDFWFLNYQFPDEQGRFYKNNNGCFKFSEELNVNIPTNWSVKSLCEIANITMGQSPDGSSYNESAQGTIFYQGSTDFGWIFPKVRQYTTEPARMAKKGDILLSVRAPVGDMNIANTDCCIGRGLAALNSKYGFDGFLFYVMKYFKQVFDRRNSEGTTFGSITKNDLYSLKLAYPPKELLEKYDNIVSKYNEMIFIRSMENQKLEELRDWLLPMLMNGQISIRDAEEHIAKTFEHNE